MASKLSFFGETARPSDVVNQILIPEIQAKVKQSLMGANNSFQYLQDILTNGAITSYKGERHNVSADEIKAELTRGVAEGERSPLDELMQLRDGLKAILDASGFKGPVRVKPAVMVGTGNAPVSSSGLHVEPFVREPQGGDPLEGGIVTALPTGQPPQVPSRKKL